MCRRSWITIEVLGAAASAARTGRKPDDINALPTMARRQRRRDLGCKRKCKPVRGLSGYDRGGSVRVVT